MATRASLSSGFERVGTGVMKGTLLHIGLIAASLLAAIGSTGPARAQDSGAADGASASTTSELPTTMAEPDLAKGRRAFQRNCAVCHGPRGEGGLGPPMQGIASRLTADDIARQLKTPRGSMPRLYPAPIDDRLLVDLQAWLLQLK